MSKLPAAVLVRVIPRPKTVECALLLSRQQRRMCEGPIVSRGVV